MATKKKKSKDQYYTLIGEYLTGDFKGQMVRIESPDPIKVGQKLNFRSHEGEWIEFLIHACTAE